MSGPTSGIAFSIIATHKPPQHKKLTDIWEKLFLDHTIKCYESFMTGADSFEEMNAELQSKLKDVYNVVASKLGSLTARNKALNELIARLEQKREKELDHLESLRKLKTSLQADIENIRIT